MSISKDLFLAVLSMDAYNRGYNSGIEDEIGIGAGLGQAGSGIGNALVLNVPLPSGSEAAGFYAISYEMTADVGEGDDKLLAGQISYRGREAAA